VSLIMFDNDATGCFDWIIVALTMIAALRLGMPCPAARMHSLALLHMNFVKTAHGVSEAFYRVLQDFLLYGTGQGSGASPLVWLLIVVVLLMALTMLAPLAMSFADPWGNIFEEQNADSFVDDTSNGSNNAHLEMAMPFAELIAHAQACAQIWERILFSSGGALELKKLFWYMVYWQWVNGRPEMCPNNSFSACSVRYIRVSHVETSAEALVHHGANSIVSWRRKQPQSQQSAQWRPLWWCCHL
jgi:hypothetical protein